MKSGDLVQLREGYFFALIWTTSIVKNCVIGSPQEIFLLPSNPAQLEIPDLDPFLWTTNETGPMHTKLNICPAKNSFRRSLVEDNDIMLIVRVTDNFVQALSTRGQLFSWSKKLCSTHYDVTPGRISEFWDVGTKNVY
jgi:hypothetical protein